MTRSLALAALAAAFTTAGAQAADLGAPRMPVAAAVVAPAFSWTGFYTGLDLGYWTGHGTTFVPGFVAGQPRPNGVTLGGHLGYRHQFANNLVLGVEADLSWLGGRRVFGTIPGDVAVYALRGTWDGSLRATAGFAVDRALFYVTGGLAVIEATGCAVANPALSTACFPGTSYGGTRAGWTVGAGFAYAVAPNWSVRAEYLYANYGSRTYATPASFTGTTVSRLETHKVRVGVSYQFTTGPSAVTARY